MIQELAKCKPHPTTISIEPRPSRSPLVIVHAINVSMLEARLDIPAKGGSEQRSFALPTFRGNRAELDPDEIWIPAAVVRSAFRSAASTESGSLRAAERPWSWDDVGSAACDALHRSSASLRLTGLALPRNPDS